MSRITVLLTAITAALLLTAASSQAVTYCVVPEASCPAGQTFATVQAAFDQAASTADADKVQLGAATYTVNAANGFFYNAGSPVEIAGKGVSTVLTRQAANAYALNVQPTTGTSSIHDLKIHLPANVAAGTAALWTGIDATRLTIDADPTQSNDHTLVYLNDDADLSSSTLTADTSGAISTKGVIPGLNSKLFDLTITARFGIVTNTPGADIDRVRITAEAGGIEFNEPGAVRNCLVRMPAGGTSAAISVYAANVSVANCTFVGSGSSPTDTGVYVNGSFKAANATLTSTVLRKFGRALLVQGGANGATLTPSYSDFDATTDVVAGGGVINAGVGNGYHANAGFLDEAGGDLRPRYDSPLVDAGDPATTGSADLQNFQRVVDGNGDGSSRVDIGAFEYPRQGPEPAIDDGPVAGNAGVELSWTGSASDPDPGETGLLTYAWQIGDGAIQPGATLKHTFTYGGAYVLHFLATDVTGVVAKLDYPVSITGPAPPSPPGDSTPEPASGGGGQPGGGASGGGEPGGGGNTQPAADTTAPQLTKVRLRRGKVRGIVDEAALVTVRIVRLGAQKPRTVRRRQRTVGAAGRFSVGLGKLRHGRYRIVVRAVDAAGNRSRAITRRVHR